MFSVTYVVKIWHGVQTAALVLALLAQAGALRGETRLAQLQLSAEDPEGLKSFLAQYFRARPDWLTAEKAAGPAPSTAFSHFGYGAAEFRSEYMRLLDAGAAVARPVTRAEVGGDYAMFAAPGGYFVELNEAEPAGLAQIYLLSVYPTVAGEWYVRHLGLRALRPLEEKAGVAVLRAGDWVITISARPKDAAEPAIGPVLRFTVDHLDQLLLNLRKTGSRVLEGPVGEVGRRRVMVQGPDRMRVELVEER